MDKRRKHGMCRTRTYQVWADMKTRCLNPKHKCYQDYGGRGIKVCDQWLVFTGFLADMGEAPAGKSLDRIDNEGHYEPGNCRWATAAQQSVNTRQNIIVEIGGDRRCLTEWCRIRGLSVRTMFYRIYERGMSPLEALTTPVGRWACKAGWSDL